MILHLVLKSDWEKLPPTQHYVPESLAKEGFIHCTATQSGLLSVANTFYKAIAGEFWVLEIDENKVNALVKWEAPAHPTPVPQPAGNENTKALSASVVNELGDSRRVPPPAELPTQFPHIYGPLNRSAVTGIRPVLRAADGAFVGYGDLLTNAPPPVQAQSTNTAPQTPHVSPQPSAPTQTTPPRPAPAADPRTPIMKAADELVDATDEFSEELKRLRGRVEAKMSQLDEEIAKL
ncbi:MAG: DUF952 domain-containing protein [Anaerolineae bacterium]|nr:DUF952 domain-containing protein [Anaerolineae bacterium]